MEKKKIGISVYPDKSSLEENKKYLDKAKKLGYEQLFISFIHLKNKDEAKKNIEVIKYAKKLGFYIYGDFNYYALDLVGDTPNDITNISKMGIDCIRFDEPVRANELAILTHNKWNIDIQINMSNNDHFIDNVIDFKPIPTRLSGGHNFYPQKRTALTECFFKECNKKFISKNLSTTAFVGSHKGNQGPASIQKELPTLELLRDLPIETQGKYLFYTNEINNVLIGNAFATDEELKKLSEVDRDRIEISVNIEKDVTDSEKDILFWDEHYRRGDINPHFIRSTFSRIKWKDSEIKPKKNNKFTFGDVVIINNNGGSYKGELHIILDEVYIDQENKYNLVAKVKDYEKILLNFISENVRFRLV